MVLVVVSVASWCQRSYPPCKGTLDTVDLPDQLRLYRPNQPGRKVIWVDIDWVSASSISLIMRLTV